MQFPVPTLLVIALSALTTTVSALSCHGSGQWAKQDDGYNRARTACNSIAGNIPGGGVYRICVNGDNSIRWDFTVRNTDDSTWNMSYNDCENNMIHIISQCHGDNSDTRGGTNDVNIGGITWGFSADPNAGLCV